MNKEARFLASFPPIQSAIKRDGSGGGMRIQLDIPESEMGNALALLAWTNKVLEVQIKVSESLDDGKSQAHKRAARSPLNLAGR